MSLQSKNGFAHPARRLRVSTGAFGRHVFEAEAGAHDHSWAYYATAGYTRDDGWRDFSPSILRRAFGDLGWRGQAAVVNLSVLVASNDLSGNGAAPAPLLDERCAAVFTHPDQDVARTVIGPGRADRIVMLWHSHHDDVLSPRESSRGFASWQREDVDAACPRGVGDEVHAGGRAVHCGGPVQR